MSLKTKFSISIISKFTNVIIVFITTIMISRSLNTNDFGIYKYLLLLISTSYLFAGIGSFESNAQLLTLKKISKEFALKYILIFSLIVYFIILSFFLILILLFEFSTISQYFLLSFVVYSFVQIYFNNFNYILVGIDKVNEYNIINTIKVLTLLISVVWLKVSHCLTLRNILISQIITSIFCIFIILIFLKPLSIKKLLKVKLDKESLKFILKRGLYIYGGNISTFLNYRLDMFILKYFWGYSIIGMYSIAVLIIEKLWLLPESLRTIIFVEIAKKRKDEDLVNITIRLVFTITLLICILLFFLSPYIIPVLFSEKYSQSIYPLQLLIPGVLFFTYSKIIASYFSAKNMVKINTITSLLAFILNLVLNLILIPRYSMIGAALASSLSYTFGGIFQLLKYKSVSNTSLKDLTFLKSYDFKRLKQLYIKRKHFT